MTTNITLGIDIGAETIKCVQINHENNTPKITKKLRIPHHKNPKETLHKILNTDFNYDDISAIAVTGRLSRIANTTLIPEKLARAKAFKLLFDNDPVTIVSIGSHGFSVLEMRHNDNDIYRENTRCSQGTGNFLMQLVERFGLSVEEASTLCENVDKPAPLSGRCPVILKTDMTHLANAGQKHDAIIAGLYDAVCENVQVLIKPALCPERILLTGGVAQSLRIQNNFKKFTQKHKLSFINSNIEETLFLDAIGCALLAAQNTDPKPTLDELLSTKEQKNIETITNIKSAIQKVQRLPQEPLPTPDQYPNAKLILGYDIGSTGSKAVAIDAESGNMLWQSYENTRANPIIAAQTLTSNFLKSPWANHQVVSAAATGSGREIVGSLLTVCFSDEPIYILNEIAAHAEGALHYNPNVDTIFEIGGQDAKYIRINQGRVVDAAMNEACSAGTGSFIEEQGKRFKGVKDVIHLSQIAQSADKACDLGQHCSVFMAEIIDEAVATGQPQENIIAGIYDSIIQNYLNRVKGNRSVGSCIFCQGMPFSSDALASAVARRTGSQVIVPPNPGTIGALGIALCARKHRLPNITPKPLNIANFLDAKILKRETFICKSTKGCGGSGNKCKIQQIFTSLNNKETKFTWGGACSLYDKGTYNIKLPDKAPNPFNEREEYVSNILKKLPHYNNAKTIALTEEFTLKASLPFFASYLSNLGFNLSILQNADQSVLKRGIEEANIPFCAPMQLFHGATAHLIDQKPDIIFQPMVLSAPATSVETRHVLCPIVQGAPKMNQLDAQFSKHQENFKDIHFFSPVIDFQPGGFQDQPFHTSCIKLAHELLQKHNLQISDENIENSFQKALKVQLDFEEYCNTIGKNALNFAKEKNIPAVVVLGRPYTIYNKILNSNVPAILREQGTIAIPIDCFKLNDQSPIFDTIFWAYSQRNLRAAHQIRRQKNLYAIWCSNYACGPDSFNLHIYEYIMQGKPYAIIETDGHSGDAGTRTRVEAFLHCVREHSAHQQENEKLTNFKDIEQRTVDIHQIKKNNDTVIIPRLGPGARAVAATLRATGINAEALPTPDKHALELGRKYTSGKECVPLCITIGSLLQRVYAETDPQKTFTFLMPAGRGPCRFGSYHHIHKITTERLNLHHRVNLWSPKDDNYFDGIPGGTAALAFCAIMAADLLLAMLYDVRPAEITQDAANKLYNHYADELDKLVENTPYNKLSLQAAALEISTQNYYGTLDLLKSAAKDFRKIKKPGNLPTVLVTGEIYVRCDPFANDYAIDKLQKRGIRVKLSPFNEWLDYQEFINTKVGVEHSWTSWLSAKIQTYIQNKFHNTVAHFLNWNKLTRAQEYIELAEPYIAYQLEGEAGLTLGSAIHDWNHNEIDGVLLVAPHECMPSKIAESQLYHLAETHDIYTKSLALNGDPLDPIVLEHFTFEVQENFKKRQRKLQNVEHHAKTLTSYPKNFLQDLIRGIPKTKQSKNN